jgi:hypothetical protein
VDSEGGSETILGRDGKPRVLSEQCSTCIGRPGNLMQLYPGRVREMVQGGVNGGGITCHQTLSYGEYPEFGGAACRWFYDHYGHLCGLYRIYGRISGFTEVDPPGQDETDEEPGHGYREAGDYS